jgi:hypothetical protein
VAKAATGGNRDVYAEEDDKLQASLRCTRSRARINIPLLVQGAQPWATGQAKQRVGPQSVDPKMNQSDFAYTDATVDDRRYV